MVYEPERIPATSLVTTNPDKKINQYVQRRVLHTKHGSSTIMLCRDSNVEGREVVVKAVKRLSIQDKSKMFKKSYVAARRNDPPSSEQSVQKEISILKSCRHASHVQLLEVIDDPSQDSVFIAMEYLCGGQIQWEYQGRPTLTIEQSRRIVRDVVLGLEYLHYHGIIHRDIKPANLVWSEDRSYVKIIDYGISHYSSNFVQVSRPHTRPQLDPLRNCTFFKDQDLLKMRGTGFFYAPEVIWLPKDTPSPSTSSDTIEPSCETPATRPPVTKSVDVWCLAVTLYCFLFGHFPFHPTKKRHNQYALNKLILDNDWEVDETMGADAVLTGGRHHPPHTPSVIGLLDQMLQKDPSKRISIVELKRHPWILQGIEDVDGWTWNTSPATYYMHPGYRWLRQLLYRLFSRTYGW